MQSSGNPNPDKTTRRQRHETGIRHSRPPSPARSERIAAAPAASRPVHQRAGLHGHHKTGRSLGPLHLNHFETHGSVRLCGLAHHARAQRPRRRDQRVPRRHADRRARARPARQGPGQPVVPRAEPGRGPALRGARRSRRHQRLCRRPRVRPAHLHQPAKHPGQEPGPPGHRSVGQVRGGEQPHRGQPGRAAAGGRWRARRGHATGQARRTDRPPPDRAEAGQAALQPVRSRRPLRHRDRQGPGPDVRLPLCRRPAHPGGSKLCGIPRGRRAAPRGVPSGRPLRLRRQRARFDRHDVRLRRRHGHAHALAGAAGAARHLHRQQPRFRDRGGRRRPVRLRLAPTSATRRCR